MSRRLRPIALRLTLPLLLLAWLAASAFGLASNPVTTGGTNVVETSYTYDDASNRTSKIVSTGPEAGRWTYTSNALNQLTGFTDHGPDGVLRHTVAFTYDANGNRATRTQDGSLTHTYAWDEFNRLKAVTMGSDTHAYAYDYRTRRISRTEPGEATAMTYAGGLSVAEFDGEWDSTPPPALPEAPELPEYPELPAFPDLPEEPEEPELPLILQNPCPEIEYYDDGYYDEFGFWVNVWLPLQYTVDARNEWLTAYDIYWGLWHSIFDPYNAEVLALTTAWQAAVDALLGPYEAEKASLIAGYLASLVEYAHEHGLEAIPASILSENHAVFAETTLSSFEALQAYLLAQCVAQYPEVPPGSAGLTGALQAEYQRGPDMGGGVGGLLYSLRASSNPSDPTIRFNLSNARGDIVAQTDTTGSITWSASYEAYGKRPVEEGTNADRQRANTKEEDPTGLLNEGFRYRDLETGTWLSRDPAGFVDGPNLYAYVRQNPWSSFDPDGLFLRYLVDKVDKYVSQPFGDWVASMVSDETCRAVRDGSGGWGFAEKATRAVHSTSKGALDALVPGSGVLDTGEKVIKSDGPVTLEQVGDLAKAAVDDFGGKKLKVAVAAGDTVAAIAEGDAEGAIEAFTEGVVEAASKGKGKSGETSATKKGRQAHKDWDAGEGFEKEVTLPSGKRADAVNFKEKHVKELKPNNPRAVKRGEKQVEEYREELQVEHGGDWKKTVETYQ